MHILSSLVSVFQKYHLLWRKTARKANGVFKKVTSSNTWFSDHCTAKNKDNGSNICLHVLLAYSLMTHRYFSCFPILYVVVFETSKFCFFFVRIVKLKNGHLSSEDHFSDHKSKDNCRNNIWLSVNPVGFDDEKINLEPKINLRKSQMGLKLKFQNSQNPKSLPKNYIWLWDQC